MIVGTENGIEWREGYGGTRQYRCPKCGRWVNKFLMIFGDENKCASCCKDSARLSRSGELKNKIDGVLKEMDYLILATPTGEVRNDICDAHLLLLRARGRLEKDGASL